MSILNRIKSGTQKIFNKKQPETIDNLEKNSNLTTDNNNLTAPETEPISKQDVGQTKTTIPTKPVTNAKPDDEPVTKQDVNNSEEETVENNKLTNSFKDMMSRWNNLNK